MAPKLVHPAHLGVALPLVLALAACQQTRPTQPEQDLLTQHPPASGLPAEPTASCPSLPPDWLQAMPAHQRRILPEDCQRLSSTPLFSWGEAPDRQAGSPWSFSLRSKGGSIIYSRSDISEPRLAVRQVLAAGDYEWAVSYRNTRGQVTPTQWRRFQIEAPARTALAGRVSASASTTSLPEGQEITAGVMAKARPRLLPAGSSFAKIATAAQAPDHLPVFNRLRGLANAYLARPIPAVPPTPATQAELLKLRDDNNIVSIVRTEREYIEVLSLIGKLDNVPAMTVNAKQRVLSLANWAPTGVSSETVNVQGNRELYLALAIGLDMLWQDLSSQERQQVTIALRARLIQAVDSLAVLDTDPYNPHRVNNLRWLSQALLLAAGLPGFPEGAALLTRVWDLSQFAFDAWGDKDGSFGNGIAYGWYSMVSTVPYVAAVRTITGLDLYQHLDYLRRAGDQMLAFTPPQHRQISPFGDEAENDSLYSNYAPHVFRLHAQMTRDPVDAWYWRADPNSMRYPSRVLIWQLLLLGADNRPLPAPQPPRQNSWFFPGGGLAAMHMDASLSARTSVFFRSSRFGAYNHSHADQNAVVYVSQGQPLLISAGYYPYYNSPHHRAVTRATRYKNALTIDGGIGQGELLNSQGRPPEPLRTMEATGALIHSEVRGTLSVVSGDATPAYRAYDNLSYRWVPLLSNAVRSVVMDRNSGTTLIYDWATSAQARQWELNYHSPQPFNADASTVRASNGSASVCLDRYGPASSFSQTTAWDVAPEAARPAQSHGRFTLLNRSTELVHLTVLRDGCRTVPLQVGQQGSRITVVIGSQTISFDKRQTTLAP